MSKLIIHTASLYSLYPNYEATLDHRIHTCLDAGLDGVEISNGPSILAWRPRQDTVEHLQDKTITVHAEILWGIKLADWVKAVMSWPFKVANAVFHPEELTPHELTRLGDLPFPISLENMDKTRSGWRTVQEMQAVIDPDVGFCLDTAHAESNGLTVDHFAPLFMPVEIHLSITERNRAHVLTHERPDDFPHVPPTCPIVCIEGVVPSLDALDREVKFLRSKLCQR